MLSEWKRNSGPAVAVSAGKIIAQGPDRNRGGYFLIKKKVTRK